jgi:GT2 family glycosyltransferase
MKIKFPNVSIIILTYNGSQYIQSLLDSLCDQTYPQDRMEIIVVDNASTDTTRSIVKNKYPHIRCVALPENIGFGAGNNRGLKHAKYDFLVFLNQDTICHRNWLQGLVEIMLEDERIAACNSNIIPTKFENFREVNRRSACNSLFYYDLSPYGYGSFRKKTGIRFAFTKLLSGCSFMIRRQIISELGFLFNEHLWMYAEDTDLSLRLHKTGHKFCAVRDSVVFHCYSNDIMPDRNTLRLSAKAIMNRVYVFYNNMETLEFILFFPLMLFGGVFKIFEFHLSKTQKFFLFFPFGIFSITCMLLALFGLPGHTPKNRYVKE